MAQNITIAGATYNAVPAVSLKNTGGDDVIYNDLSGVNGIVKSDGAGHLSAADAADIRALGAQIYTGTTELSSSTGADGDIYLRKIY